MTIRKFELSSPYVDPTVYVDTSAIIIGNVHLSKDVSVWPMCVLRGDVNKITVAEGTNIQDGCIIHVNHPSEFNPNGDAVSIGSKVTIAHQVMLHGCTIEDNVLIGIGVTVLDQAYVKSEVIVGAGSLVPPRKVLESGYLYLGNPVKKIRPLTIKEKFFLRYNAEHYIELKDRHK